MQPASISFRARQRSSNQTTLISTYIQRIGIPFVDKMCFIRNFLGLDLYLWSIDVCRRLDGSLQPGGPNSQTRDCLMEADY